MFESVQLWLYTVAQTANEWLAGQLAHPSLGTVVGVAIAGLLTSLTPCMLSMLPITVGYIGGYETPAADAETPHPPSLRWASAVQSLWFALGLATTLAGMGVAAAWLGAIYGQVGWGLPLVISVVAIVMGLNLLEIVPLRFPSWGGMDWIGREWPRGVRSYLVGLTFGLVASPCSTPVLATLLAWVAATRQPLWGSVMLLAYAIGYVSPLVLAGTFAGSLRQLVAVRQWSGWITPASGVLLVGFGVFSLLNRLPLGGWAG